jgi:hypothetical protein
MNHRIWKFLTSLRVTVVLLLLSTLLVFLGTLAQIHEGLWEAQERWFKSFLVVRRGADSWWVPPFFPGGYTLGWSLLLNLVAAHINRFQWSTKKIGIHLTHAGIILLLLGQLATDMLSRESFISFEEGQTRDYSEAHRSVELVVLGEPDNGRERVVSFVESAVARKQPLIAPDLPFEIRVSEWGENADVHAHATLRELGTQMQTAIATMKSKYGTAEALPREAELAVENGARAAIWAESLKAVGERDPDIVAAAKRVAADPVREGMLRKELQTRFSSQMLEAFAMRQPTMEKMQAAKYIGAQLAEDKFIPLDTLPAAASQGAGQRMLLLPKPVSRGMDERNFPYAKAELVEKGGKSLGTWVLSPWIVPQEVQAGGHTFRIALRGERYAQPFSLTLLKTTHEVYPGTQIPKNFQSRVLLENKEKGERREVEISMNNPLRYGGLTFYQHQMGRTETMGGKGNSQLQVVRNPGWITPYLGCAVVSLGMVWQFLYHLLGFLTRPRPNKASVQTRTEAPIQA